MSDARSDTLRALAALPTAEPERYVTRQELAALMGVSTKQIDRWKDQGMPYESWGLRVTRYKPSVAIQWVRARRRAA